MTMTMQRCDHPDDNEWEETAQRGVPCCRDMNEPLHLTCA
jgi:hypothetical protein